MSTESKVLAAIKARYAAPAYATLTHVPDATGLAKSRTADAIAMSLWPSRGLDIIGFEVKVSRSDLARELADPAKAESVCRYCDRWYLAVAECVKVQPGELPATWGLLQLCGDRLKVVTEAPKLAPAPVSREWLAAILRRATEGSTVEAIARERIAAARHAARAEADAAAEIKYQNTISRLETERDGLARRISDFEAASGLTIGMWDRPRRIGEAARFVMDGGIKAAAIGVERIRAAAADVIRAADQLAEHAAYLETEAAR